MYFVTKNETLHHITGFLLFYVYFLFTNISLIVSQDFFCVIFPDDGGVRLPHNGVGKAHKHGWCRPARRMLSKTSAAVNPARRSPSAVRRSWVANLFFIYLYSICACIRSLYRNPTDSAVFVCSGASARRRRRRL